MTLDEVLQVVHLGAQQGAIEVLFTLGERSMHSTISHL